MTRPIFSLADSFTRFAILLALGGPSFAGNEFVVDQNGNADFLEIQDAVDASQSGDQILVLAGAYSGFTITSQGIHIAAADGAVVTIHGTMSVHDLLASELVSLRGLLGAGGVPLASSTGDGLNLSNCQGSLRINDCEFQTFSGFGSANSAIVIENCKDVALSSCVASIDYPTGLHGVRASNSTVAAFRSSFEGGRANLHGGNGLLLTGVSGLFYGTGCSIAGGSGRDALCQAGSSSSAGNGGDGLFNEAWDVRLQDTTLIPGGGGAGDSTFSCNEPAGADGLPSQGPITFLPGVGRSLELDATIHELDVSVSLTFQGQPGDLAYVYPSQGADFDISRGSVGPRLLSEPYLGIFYSVGTGVGHLGGGYPLGLQSHFLGVVDGTGTLNVQIPLSGNWVPGETRHMQLQGLAIDTAGTPRMTDAQSISFTPCDSGLDCNGNGIGDICDLAYGFSLDCNGNGIPDECEWDCNGNGIPDDCDLASGFSLDVNRNGTADECEQSIRLHVNSNATPGGDGLAWATAITDLQDALYLQRVRPNEIEEIWVASGIYKPTQDADRTVSFQPGPATRLRGGFAGSETTLSQRDLSLNPTVLTGDLFGNDVFPMGLEENSNHVLLIEQANNVMVDGFTIRGGNALTGIVAGGGIYIFQSRDFLISRCRIENNHADFRGGGISIRGITGAGSLNGHILNCSILNNRAVRPQGGSSEGAGVYISTLGSIIRFTNCDIAGNYTKGYGGAISFLLIGGSLEILACTITGNSADSGGPGVLSNNSNASVHGTLVWDNVTNTSNPAFLGGIAGFGTFMAYDVRWSNIDSPTVYPGIGNINLDPMFVNPSLGDYRLSAGSPCIDAGRSAALLDTDPSDLDQDGVIMEELPLDLTGVIRRLDDPNTVDVGPGPAPVIDIGAHEFDPGVP